jgi:hypothetical protein
MQHGCIHLALPWIAWARELSLTYKKSHTIFWSGKKGDPGLTESVLFPTQFQSRVEVLGCLVVLAGLLQCYISMFLAAIQQVPKGQRQTRLTKSVTPSTKRLSTGYANHFSSRYIQTKHPAKQTLEVHCSLGSFETCGT